MVMQIAEWLLSAGRRPLIAMRGYGSRPGRPSDEQAEYQDRFPDLCIVARPDRLSGIRPIIEAGRADCVILDDGFQHRFIARDLDLVLIDASRSPFTDRCLPAGWLREPVDSLLRASAVVLTHAEMVSEPVLSDLAARIKALTGRAPIASARHEWAALNVHRYGGQETSEPIAALQGLRVVAACAIGNPEPFLSAVGTRGATLSARMLRRDHHAWSAADLHELHQLLRGYGADAVITTEKDWVKLRHLDIGGLTLIRPVLTLNFGGDERNLRDLILSALTPEQAPHTRD